MMEQIGFVRQTIPTKTYLKTFSKFPLECIFFYLQSQVLVSSAFAAECGKPWLLALFPLPLPDNVSNGPLDLSITHKCWRVLGLHR
jgi:hypothetical protein